MLGFLLLLFKKRVTTYPGFSTVLTLTVIDNEDATGMTAVVGGTAGKAVTVYVSQVNEQTGRFIPGWTSTGNRTGDGTVSLPTVAGYFFVMAITATDISAPVYAHATTGLDSVATRFRRAVAARIALLNLPITGVEEQWTPDESNLQFPCVVLTVDNVMETTRAVYSSNRVDHGYPCRVMICDRADRYDQTTLPDYESWRQSIIRAFERQQLAAPVENIVCEIEFDAIINPNLPRFQFMVSEFTIRGHCRELMGLGA